MQCAEQQSHLRSAAGVGFHLSREESESSWRVKWEKQGSFETKYKSACFKNILDFARRFDFCRLTKIILEAFLTFISYFFGSTKYIC